MENEKRCLTKKRDVQLSVDGYTLSGGIELAQDALSMRVQIASGKNEDYEFDVDTTVTGWLVVTVKKRVPDEAWGKWRSLAISPTALVELAIGTGLINANLDVEAPLQIVAVAGE